MAAVLSRRRAPLLIAALVLVVGVVALVLLLRGGDDDKKQRAAKSEPLAYVPDVGNDAILDLDTRAPLVDLAVEQLAPRLTDGALTAAQARPLLGGRAVVAIRGDRAWLAFATDAGIREELICLDPGIGFGKTVEHNLEILKRLGEIVALGRPVLVGASRKRFLGRVLGDADAVTGPLAAGVAVAVMAYERGATIIRAHDVREHVEALRAAQAVAETTA